MTDETPLWQKIAGLLFVIVWAAIIILWHSRAGADLYPLDASRVAPNLVASFILFSLGIIFGALLWPPTRRRMHRFVDRKLEPIHQHLEHAAADRRHLHAKLDRLHEHLGIERPPQPGPGLDVKDPDEA